MCGRYEIVDGKRVFTRFAIRTPQPSLFDDNHDIRPTNQVPVVLPDQVLAMMQWGLIPFWAKDAKIGQKLINARAEGIAEKPSFKRPLRFQRCIIPASAFFEWQGSTRGAKIKYRMARKDGDLFGFAGLYDTWKSPTGERLATCTIITTTPNSLMAPIHTRMPVILLPEDEEAWLSPDLTEVEQLASMLHPYPDALLEARAA